MYGSLFEQQILFGEGCLVRSWDFNIFHLFLLFFSLSPPKRAFLDFFPNFPLWKFNTRDYGISIYVMYVYLCFIHEMSKNKIPLSPQGTSIYSHLGVMLPNWESMA